MQAADATSLSLHGKHRLLTIMGSGYKGLLRAFSLFSHPSFRLSFTGTDLQKHLQSLGVNQVALTGYQVQLCISNTACSAQELGYDVVLVRDAIATRDIPSADGKSRIPAAQVMEVVCAELADAVATVIWSEEIVA